MSFLRKSSIQSCAVQLTILEPTAALHPFTTMTKTHQAPTTPCATHGTRTSAPAKKKPPPRKRRGAVSSRPIEWDATDEELAMLGAYRDTRGGALVMVATKQVEAPVKGVLTLGLGW